MEVSQRCTGVQLCQTVREVGYALIVETCYLLHASLCFAKLKGLFNDLLQFIFQRIKHLKSGGKCYHAFQRILPRISVFLHCARGFVYLVLHGFDFFAQYVKVRVITAIQLHFLFQSLQSLSQLTHTATRQIAHHLVVSFKLKSLLLGLLVKLLVGFLKFAVFLGVRLTVLLQLHHLVVEVFHVLFQHV